VDIDGTLTLIFPTKRDYPLEDTYVASVLIGGNLQVRASVPFTQRNWTNVWQDTRIGDEPLNRLNVKDYPIVLTDDGAITEKWLIKFTSSSQFELYGQTLGFVAKTDTLQDLAPTNPIQASHTLRFPNKLLERTRRGACKKWYALTHGGRYCLCGSSVRYNRQQTTLRGRTAILRCYLAIRPKFKAVLTVN
jgi:hypothetical protein